MMVSGVLMHRRVCMIKSQPSSRRDVQVSTGGPGRKLSNQSKHAWHKGEHDARLE